MYVRAICSDYKQLYLEGIVIGKLTSNTTVQLYVYFQATQRDNPIRQGVALLHLVVIGQGGSLGPSFAQSRYHAVVSESEAVGTTILTVTITDQDQVGWRSRCRKSINQNLYNSLSPSRQWV